MENYPTIIDALLDEEDEALVEYMVQQLQAAGVKASRLASVDELAAQCRENNIAV